MNPQEAQTAFEALARNGPWGLAVFLVIVQIATTYFLFKFFQSQLEKKEETNRILAESWNRQTEAINRRTRSENARTELEALQLASRPDLHHELKSAATDVVRRLKEGEEGASNG